MSSEKATFAAGCFWGVEEIFRAVPGVLHTTVGYLGGQTDAPTYEQVCRGDTGHAEAIEITFDPARITYLQLLGYFFRLHDPTTLNRQGGDRGTQYRSAIFYHSAEQHQQAQQAKQRVEASGRWPNPVVTEIVAASHFFPAEEHHQDYLQKHPDGYHCHILRPED